MSDRFSAARPVDVGALGAAMSAMRGGFAETGFEALAGADAGEGEGPAPEPRHFRPANPGINPTAGWDPFDPLGEKLRAAPPAEPAEPSEPAPPPPDPLALARAEGYADGLAAAERIAAEMAAADHAALAALGDRLADLAAVERDALAARLRQTVLHLVGQLVGDIGVAADRLAPRIAAAADLLAESSEAASLRLHPADLKLLEGRLPPRLLVIADAGLERGAFRLETRQSAVEDGPAIWLAQLAGAIDRVPLPEPR